MARPFRFPPGPPGRRSGFPLRTISAISMELWISCRHFEIIDASRSSCATVQSARIREAALSQYHHFPLNSKEVLRLYSDYSVASSLSLSMASLSSVCKEIGFTNLPPRSIKYIAAVWSIA
jgi:hypothetical protein